METDMQDFKEACEFIHQRLSTCLKYDDDADWDSEPTPEDLAEITRLLEPFFLLFWQRWGDEIQPIDFSEDGTYDLLDICAEDTFFDSKLEFPVICGTIGGCKPDGDRPCMVFVESNGTIRTWTIDCGLQYRILATDFAFDEAYTHWTTGKTSEAAALEIKKVFEKERPP